MTLNKDLEKVRTLMSVNKYDEALDILKEINKKDPNNHDTLNQIAKCLYKTGDYDKAIAVLEDIIKITPDAPIVIGAFGSCYEGKDDLDKAIEYFDKAANIAKEQGKDSLVRTYKKRLLGIKEEQQNTFNANILEEAKKLLPSEEESEILGSEEGLTALTLTFKLLNNQQPNNPEILTALGSCLYYSDEPQEALKCLEQSLEADGNNIEALNLLGQLHYSMQTYDKARECFNKALEIEPDNFVALDGIASAYYLLKDDNNAIYYHRKAFEKNPDDKDTLTSIISLLQKTKRYSEALEYEDDAKRILKDDHWIFCRLDICKQTLDDQQLNNDLGL